MQMQQNFSMAQPQAVLQWSYLQNLIANNIPTIAIDAVAAGADPTGQVDATATLQNILNQSGNLYLREGIYKISAPLTITRADPNTELPVNIWCDSQAAIQMTDGAFSCLVLTNCNNIYIRGIYFSGGTGALFGIVSIQSGANFTQDLWIDQCVLQGFTTNISLSQINVAWITNCFSGTNSVHDMTNGVVFQLFIAQTKFQAAAKITGSALIQSRGCFNLDDYSQAFNWPAVQVFAGAGQVTAAGAFAPVAFSTSTGAGTSRGMWNGVVMIPPVTGTYRVDFQVTFNVALGTIIDMLLQLLVNGAIAIPLVQNESPGGAQVSLSSEMQFNSGDHIAVQVLQNSAGNQTINQARGSLSLICIP